MIIIIIIFMQNNSISVITIVVNFSADHSQKPIPALIRVTFTVDKGNAQYIHSKEIKS